MTVRPRYTPRIRARHLTAVITIAWQAIHPVITIAAGAIRIILTRRWIDPQETR